MNTVSATFCNLMKMKVFHCNLFKMKVCDLKMKVFHSTFFCRKIYASTLNKIKNAYFLHALNHTGEACLQFFQFPRNFEGCIADWCQPSLYDKATSALASLKCKVWGAIGCHPHFVAAYNQNVERTILDRITNDSRMIAIGEMGLDYSDRCFVLLY